MRLFEREMERKKPVLSVLFLLISSTLCKGKTYISVKFLPQFKTIVKGRESQPATLARRETRKLVMFRSAFHYVHDFLFISSRDSNCYFLKTRP